MSACSQPEVSAEPEAAVGYALAIHGGAGVIERSELDARTEAAYRGILAEALQAGRQVLQANGSAVDAVIASILVLEDSELFNAGRGAVLTHEGRVELDASLMRGEDLDAGAVAGVSRIRHPILAAQAVMERSPHVLLAGAGADAFAEGEGLELVDNEWFITERRREQLERAREADRVELDHTGSRDAADDPDRYFGTVGAVALDAAGNLAAGTSTGGMTNKRFGRVGDSPIIGAGTYASNDACAVSATGHGEYFIRRTVARDICALMQYGGLDLAAAARRVVQDDLVAMGGSGGIIAVDPAGRIVLEMNTPGMYRASVRSGESPSIAIFADETE
ncbi:MAG: isoaspartyl peptidase/L-asparaginase [Gammaproteobacteria bacterium]|nr:isoaspartyl peptidase/L-asparaginase [Gammaproteobacteria bacterium]